MSGVNENDPKPVSPPDFAPISVCPGCKRLMPVGPGTLMKCAHGSFETAKIENVRTVPAEGPPGGPPYPVAEGIIERARRETLNEILNALSEEAARRDRTAAWGYACKAGDPLREAALYLDNRFGGLPSTGMTQRGDA